MVGKSFASRGVGRRSKKCGFTLYLSWSMPQWCSDRVLRSFEGSFLLVGEGDGAGMSKGSTRVGKGVDGAVPDSVDGAISPEAKVGASFSASKRRMPYFTEASIWPSAPLAAVVATQWTLAHGD